MSLGSRSDRNSAASCSSLDGMTSSEVEITKQEITGFVLIELKRRQRRLKSKVEEEEDFIVQPEAQEQHGSIIVPETLLESSPAVAQPTEHAV
ncbi:hypothetical protein VIGAN_03119400 [Vigna angularis var. angularis]|uniref:Uncharacterized protein n=1 Tax=Vigna angularis var. angularis TaxID=157739 RepID=A0A0S3RLL8_PHAAN|nr:hypothetical protein VIGAN_03119400 [Vigna angularis var. angularis]